ncbi:unnamed protein product [Pseudo-nitzschia multistriata]|uniref:EGF-like domain-containing protein n=1 Tax=Pseudo-nitzschia multistriata TaxID=183589 RepID=A0A448ZP72_9STRA|nr:unnamed protein product [Pseudo-nitzschia multistriata]
MIVRKLSPSRLFLLLVAAIGTGTASAYDWTCNLYCYNKGVCRHGHGKFGAYAGIDSEIDDLPFEQELHENGMYCTCPKGYTGLQCEIKFVTCGRDSHTCFNGSACVKERSTDTGEAFYRCACDAEGSIMDAPYAGKYCEHIATVFCDGGGDGFEHGSAFCTNGGRCRQQQTDDPDLDFANSGCDCPEGWEGRHCEIKTVTSVSTVAEDIVHEMKEFLSAGEIAGIVIGFCIGISLLICFRKQRFFFKTGFRKSHRGRGRTNRRHGRKQQEMTMYSDNRGDII